MPAVGMIPRRTMRLCALSLLLLSLQLAGHVPGTRAQGFGLAKKTIKLQRKLPAAVQLPGNGFDVKVDSHEAANADAAHMLTDLVTTEMQKYNKKLQVKETSPDVVIRCTIMTFTVPPPSNYARNETVYQNGKAIQKPVAYFKETGSVSITYQAKDNQSRILDSDRVTENYSQEFQAGTNESTAGSIETKLTNPFKKLAGKKTDEPASAPNALELRQLLLSRAATQIASRLVNTDEDLEVPLARGKMDEANQLAEKGQWERYLETLEGMPPFTKGNDDAYRLYNIGVAYEALAYQSEDKKATEKFLEKAAINYGKAIDADPGEKLFIDPQNRIQTAVEHYKRLEESGTAEARAESASSGGSASSSAGGSKTSNPAKSTTGGSGSRSSTVSANKPPATPGSTPNASPAAKAPAKAAAPAVPAAPALTNAQVIKMAKAGVDEENIVATIHDATSIQFDLTPDGLVNLASNGVKGKIVAAMRERAKRPSR